MKNIPIIFGVVLLLLSSILSIVDSSEISNNIPPVADADGPYFGEVGETIQFDGSGSYDPDGTIISFDWDFGDGNTSNEMNPTHVYGDDGKFIVVLNVTDDDGLNNTSITQAIIIYPSPISDANGPYEGSVSYPVNFSGSAYNGTPPYSYLWSFGDSIFSQSQNPNHTYYSEGFYIVSLKVTDNNSMTDTDYTTVNITTGNNPPYEPRFPYPTDGAQDVPTNIILKWGGDDPDEGDTVTYDVYFGSMPPLQKVSSNQSETSYNPGGLFNDLTYFWNVVAWDNHGEKTIGPSWYFTTGEEEDNTPPDVNIISPTPGLYLFNNKIIDLPNIIIAVGTIDVVAVASDESGIDYVECEFVRMPMISTKTYGGELDQYVFTLSHLSFGRWFVTVTANDTVGNSAFDKIEIWKYL